MKFIGRYKYMYLYLLFFLYTYSFEWGTSKNCIISWTQSVWWTPFTVSNIVNSYSVSSRIRHRERTPFQMDNVDASSSNNLNTLCTMRRFGVDSYKIYMRNAEHEPNTEYFRAKRYYNTLSTFPLSFRKLLLSHWYCAKNEMIGNIPVIPIALSVYFDWKTVAIYRVKRDRAQLIENKNSSRSSKKKRSRELLVLSVWVVSFTFAIHFRMSVYIICILLNRTSNIHFEFNTIFHISFSVYSIIIIIAVFISFSLSLSLTRFSCYFISWKFSSSHCKHINSYGNLIYVTIESNQKKNDKRDLNKSHYHFILHQR